jgi:hypothetical protein
MQMQMIHHTTDRHQIAFFELSDVASDLHDPTDNLVPGYTRIDCVMPFVADLDGTPYNKELLGEQANPKNPARTL